MVRWPRSKRGDAMHYRKTGGFPPPDNEVLDIEPDGSFRLWRTNARASRPPTPVGRFAGRVPGPELGELQAAAAACRPIEPPTASLIPDAAVESITVGERQYRGSDGEDIPGPWGDLVSQLRRLLVSLTDQPAAAVALGRLDATTQLRHLGSEPLELDLSGAVVRGVSWDADGGIREEWQYPVDGPRMANAAPGWTFDLPAGDGPPASTVLVDGLLAYDGQFWTTCSLASDGVS
jgi:hypothetical protein